MAGAHTKDRIRRYAHVGGGPIDTIDGKPLLFNPYGNAFHEARRMRLPDGSRAYRRFLLLAGRRSGKSISGAQAAVEEATAAKTRGWCLAPTEDDLHQFVIPKVLQFLPIEWIADWSEEFWDLTLTNGSVIHFQHCENPDRLRGPGLHWMWWDEPCSVAEVCWTTASPMLLEHKGIAWFTSTPRGEDWVHDRFLKRALPGDEQRPGYWAITWKTADSPHISKEEVEAAREDMDDLMFQQEYEAAIVTFQGAIYGERVNGTLLESEEEIKEYLPEWPDIPREYDRVVGLDPGADHPFAAAFGVATPKGLVIYDEYEQRMTATGDHAQALLEMVDGCESVRWGVDRSAAQVQIELAQHGINASAAENNVWAGIQRVQTWMKRGQLKIIKSQCPRLVKQLRNYRWADNVTPKGEAKREEPLKRNDDLCDALRYLVMTWPMLPAAAKPREGRDPATVPQALRPAWERLQRIERRAGSDDWQDFEELDGFLGDGSPVGEMFAEM